MESKSNMRLTELVDRPPLIKTFFVVVVVAILDETSFGVTAVQDSARHETRLGQIVVRRATTKFDDMETSYQTFHFQLTKFTEGISNQLTSNAPNALSTKVSSLTKLISPDDKSFTLHDAKIIEKRSKLTVTVTRSYLKAVEDCQYIKDGKDNPWFVLHDMMLSMSATFFELALKSYLESPEGVEDMSGGAGGINPGVDALDPNVIADLKDLLGALRC